MRLGRDRHDDHDGAEAVRHEERLVADVTPVEAGRVRVRKVVDEVHHEEVVGRGVEHAEVEREPGVEADSGQVETLPDGSLSIPVFEERIVVEKRLVVRERIIVRKRTVTEDHLVAAELQRERVEVDVEDDVADRVEVDGTDR